MIDFRPAQKRLGLAVDGLGGPVTFAAILRIIASPKAKVDTLTAMARALATFADPLAGLNTPRRLAGYISNTANETGGFTVFAENLNYSAQRMAEVWPNRYAFDPKAKIKVPNPKAVKLAADPVAFANDVYGARMGNELNGTADNDGFDFRGLGPMATTGYSNFLACEKHTGIPFTTQPALMADPGIGTIGALSWWSRSGCNAYLDRGQSMEARSIANAGHPNIVNPEGWAKVAEYEAKLLKVLL